MALYTAIFWHSKQSRNMAQNVANISHFSALNLHLKYMYTIKPKIKFPHMREGISSLLLKKNWSSNFFHHAVDVHDVGVGKIAELVWCQATCRP